MFFSMCYVVDTVINLKYMMDMSFFVYLCILICMSFLPFGKVWHQCFSGYNTRATGCNAGQLEWCKSSFRMLRVYNTALR